MNHFCGLPDCLFSFAALGAQSCFSSPGEATGETLPFFSASRISHSATRDENALIIAPSDFHQAQIAGRSEKLRSWRRRFFLTI